MKDSRGNEFGAQQANLNDGTPDTTEGESSEINNT
jgi:hypothetical protein